MHIESLLGIFSTRDQKHKYVEWQDNKNGCPSHSPMQMRVDTTYLLNKYIKVMS